MTKSKYFNRKKVPKLTPQVTKKIASEIIQRDHRELIDEAANEALILCLALPVKVLIENGDDPDYIAWFTEETLNWYRKWQDGEITIKELQKDLWKKGGVQFEKV